MKVPLADWRSVSTSSTPLRSMRACTLETSWLSATMLLPARAADRHAAAGDLAQRAGVEAVQDLEARGEDPQLGLARNVGRAAHEDQVGAAAQRDDVQVLEPLALRESRRVQVRAVGGPDVLDPVVLAVERDLRVTPRDPLVGDPRRRWSGRSPTRISGWLGIGKSRCSRRRERKAAPVRSEAMALASDGTGGRRRSRRGSCRGGGSPGSSRSRGRLTSSAFMLATAVG